MTLVCSFRRCTLFTVNRGDVVANSISRPEALGVQIANVLRKRIVRGELAPGERITEEGLAEEFNVSRGPIRDALTQLTSERLVRVTRPRGVFVVGLSGDDIDQLYSLRDALEQLAVSRAMRVTDESRWATTAASVDSMVAAADAGDHKAFLAADLDFHTSLYALADHPRLEAAWRLYLPTFETLLEITVNHDQDLHESANAHVALYELMRSGDTEAAARELRIHLQQAEDRMREELDPSS